MHSFRPRIWGLIFYHAKKFSKNYKGGTDKFPSRYWGLIFYQVSPHVARHTYISIAFPSPYWGLIFYLSFTVKWNLLAFIKRFRPRIGDYFFIPTLYNYDN